MSIYTDFTVQRLHDERAARLHDEAAVARLVRRQGEVRGRRPWWRWLRRPAARQYRGRFETAL